jgi:hypothetical protein
MVSIKTTVSNLSNISSAAPLSDAFDIVRLKGLITCTTSLTFTQTLSPAKAILACLAILLDVRGSPSCVDGLVTSV